MNQKIPSGAELASWYWEVLKHSSYVHELTNYQKSKLCTYAIEEKQRIMRYAWEMACANPKYDYPPSFSENHVGYFLKHDNYYQPVLVLNLLGYYTDDLEEEWQNDLRIISECGLTIQSTRTKEDESDIQNKIAVRSTWFSSKGKKYISVISNQWKYDNYKDGSKKRYAYKFLAMLDEGFFGFSDFRDVKMVPFMKEMNQYFNIHTDESKLKKRILEIERNRSTQKNGSDLYVDDIDQIESEIIDLKRIISS